MRALYRRWRTLIGEAWRFGIVGAANVVINFVVFNALALTLFPGGELKANVLATAVATTSSYAMNRGWTFRHRRTSRIPREYVLFVLLNGAGLAIELAVMGLAKYGLALTSLWALNLAKVAGLGLGTVFRFWAYRSFVFAAPRAAGATAPAGSPARAPAAALANVPAVVLGNAPATILATAQDVAATAGLAGAFTGAVAGSPHAR